MKKSGFLIFMIALTVGLMFASSCNLNVIKSTGGLQGSGNSKTEQRNLSGFTKIKAEGAVEIEITAQKSFAVEVSADDNLIQMIKTEIDGETLKISNSGNISTKTRVLVKVSLPELKSLDLSGASSGDVKNIKTDSFKVKASGASKVKIDGEVNKFNAEASGASKIDAENLQTQNADVEAEGASNATVSAVEELKADAAGASTIYYTGEPRNLKQNSSGASSIQKK